MCFCQIFFCIVSLPSGRGKTRKLHVPIELSEIWHDVSLRRHNILFLHPLKRAELLHLQARSFPLYPIHRKVIGRVSPSVCVSWILCLLFGLLFLLFYMLFGLLFSFSFMFFLLLGSSFTCRTCVHGRRRTENTQPREESHDHGYGARTKEPRRRRRESSWGCPDGVDQKNINNDVFFVV